MDLKHTILSKTYVPVDAVQVIYNDGSDIGWGALEKEIAFVLWQHMCGVNFEKNGYIA